ncbi:hypothetical protein [Roseibium sediminicola]|uniref:Methyl-accepting chemotaxis protein n=1 Tax=Roseibium sediminicola TaxID=2933272 RepID=A0ABT0GU72_9HYPH|nr:hypothetical protein [Roseibium sp. CAU 1639]MCK7612627.1 hypothetical protein [Roseibium sp. CAU 1639]
MGCIQAQDAFVTWANAIIRNLRSAIAIVSCLAIGLASCTTYNGVAEFELYRRAFDQSYQTGNAILDILAGQERKIFLNAHPPQTSTFNPDNASYYVDTVDPPGTAAFRRALESVKTYNDILAGLASGEVVEALSGKLLGLNETLNSAAAETKALLNSSQRANIVQATGSIGQLDARIRAASEVAKLALKYKSREDFRRFVREYNPTVIEILKSLRDGTRIIFPSLTRSALNSIAGVNHQKVSAYRKLLADWVISLDATMAALKRVSVAIEANASLDSTISAFSKSAIELQIASEAARKHLAEVAAN